MAKLCELCGKGSQMGGKRRLLRAHYNPTKWERKQPNLQWARLSSGQRAKICTACIRKNKQAAAKK